MRRNVQRILYVSCANYYADCSVQRADHCAGAILHFWVQDQLSPGLAPPPTDRHPHPPPLSILIVNFFGGDNPRVMWLLPFDLVQINHTGGNISSLMSFLYSDM